MRPPLRPAHAVCALTLAAWIAGCAGEGEHPAPTSWAAQPTVEVPRPTPPPPTETPDVACMRPAEGCPCDPGSAAVSCNARTGTTAPDPSGTCEPGQRACRNGRWGACEGYVTPDRLVAQVASCYGSCDTACRRQVDCMEPSDPWPSGAANLASASVAPAVYCPSGAGAGGVTPRCVTAVGGAYRRVASTQPWLEACDTGVTVMANADEGVFNVALPFSFLFYGVPYSTVVVGANGTLSFGAVTSEWSNTTLPSAAMANTVFALWDDLVLRSTGACTATFGASPNRQFVVEWKDAAVYPGPDASTHLTFEVVLSEATQSLDIVYQTLAATGEHARGGSATVGVQRGEGSTYDLIAYNTPGAVDGGTSFRWAPPSNSVRCARGTYRKVYEAGCDPTDLSLGSVWGALHYVSSVPSGGAIRWSVRAADALADLASQTAWGLPDAPAGTASSPVTVDVGLLLRARAQGAERMRYLELTADLDPGITLDAAPTLSSLEVQYACLPTEVQRPCVAGAVCFTAGTCRRGVTRCLARYATTCDAQGLAAAGTSCGAGLVCNSAGNCVACVEGASCDTGNACQQGSIACATGAPVCRAGTNLPAGSVCSTRSGAWTRGAAAYGWLDACGATGHDTALAAVGEGRAAVSLPFPFRIGGSAVTSAWVTSNGVLSFDDVAAPAANTGLPSGSFTRAVAAFWDDLLPRGGVCTATFGSAPDRLFAAQWHEVDLEDRGATGDPAARMDFEVVLEESTRAVSVLYGAMDGATRATGSSATVGLQSAAGVADQVGYNVAGVTAANTSYRWTPPTGGTCDGAGACVPCAVSETCNGRDDDCNALIDDAIADQSCGVGACRRTVAGCVRGVVPTCTPGTPVAETCNLVDDNCNGVVDEGCTGTLSCPGNITMYASDTVSLSVTTTGVVRSLSWNITAAPTGGATSAVWTPSARTSTTETFQPFIIGTYTISVTATDGTGHALACAFNVTAQGHGMRVQLTWDGSGDVDLHLHNNTLAAWFTSDDTHYNNMTPSWGAVQDVDNTRRDGPENIRVNSPAVGAIYDIGVHNYASASGRRATVQVFCGGGVTPVATYVSRALTGTRSGNCTTNDFWRVARVTMTSSGTCLLLPIDTYTTSSNACTFR